MTTEDYLDKALKYAQERYDERHYEDEDTMDTFSDWGEDYEAWANVWGRALRNHRYLRAIHQGHPDRSDEEFARNPLNLAALEAAKILVKEKGL